ncbi:MAG: GGDEF domain-containing protein [Desulfonatronovibrio sp.]|nr:GGDEF domain-containing protein [Desulfovibrionales bacterium]
METNITGSAKIELQRLEKRKQIAYLIALISGVLIFMLSWIIRDPTDSFIKVLYPVFSLILAVFIPIVYKSWIPLRRLELILISIVSAMVLSRLFWHFHFSGSISDQMLMLIAGHYWAVGVIIIGSFVMLGHKKGLVAGGTVISVSLIIAASGMSGPLISGEMSLEHVIYIIRVHLFLGLLLGLTSAATTIHDKYRDALIRADLLEEMTQTDMLTGIANRRCAEDFLSQQVYLADRYGRKLSVITADIDYFKNVNDNYGHAIGDKVLIGVAKALKSYARESDMVSRWGGEEFLIIAPEISVTEAQKMAERFKETIARNNFSGVKVTVSMGVTEFKKGESMDSILMRADDLLYKAKVTGRNATVSG